MAETIKTQIAIIGAGPVGLFAGFEAGMLNLDTIIIDALDFPGGQCSALYPEKPIYDIPAHPSIAAEDLIKHLQTQIEPFNHRFLMGQQVIACDKKAHGDFELKTSQGATIQCASIIIAAGCGAFGPNRPPLDGLEDYEGHSVHYMVHQKENFRNKNIAIAGGGDSAVDWAIALKDIAQKIYVVHRRAKFRCAPESQKKLEALSHAGEIELLIPYQLHGLNGDGKSLDSLVLKNLDGQTKTIAVDYLLPFFGLATDLGPIAQWGLQVDHHHIHVAPNTMETNVEGIFAIGDIATYEHKLKLILTGFSEAAMACYAARRYIFPEQSFHFEYSTTSGLPQ